MLVALDLAVHRHEGPPPVAAVGAGSSRWERRAPPEQGADPEREHYQQNDAGHVQARLRSSSTPRNASRQPKTVTPTNAYATMMKAFGDARPVINDRSTSAM